ncbi:Na+/H+ antiporter subunit E [Dietzia lutea]|uniref:Sodium:proton antiporter n=1 Tax=Dietzia lutea TaxID=546160 RepID=A0A2S1R9P2_9ACTN|nr:Na+/H+ antiporter subunit E [Dietzia lutea]AWH93009.1 hypothetical protein A6035_13445 [Dietzia lutea]
MRGLLFRTWHTLVLVGFVLWRLTADSVKLVAALVNPRHRFAPYLVEVPLRCRTDRSVAVLASLVALSSPRQVSVGVETEPRRMLVYMLDAADAATVRRDAARLETLFLRAIGSPARVEEPPEVTE